MNPPPFFASRIDAIGEKCSIFVDYFALQRCGKATPLSRGGKGECDTP